MFLFQMKEIYLIILLDKPKKLKRLDQQGTNFKAFPKHHKHMSMKKV